MEYPSFVWEKGIGENRARCPIIRENVLADLKIGELFREEVQKYALIPCNGSEICRRQVLFGALEKNQDAEEALFRLRDDVLRYKKTVTAFQISETEREKSVFFAVMVSSFLGIAAKFTELSVYGDSFFPVGNFFDALLQEPFFQELAADVNLCFSHRGEHVRLRIGGGDVTAFANSSPMEKRFAEWFEIMGISEERPVSRAHRRPDPLCFESYEASYPFFIRQAEEIYGKYRDSLLGEKYNITDLVLYGDEIFFIKNVLDIIRRFRGKGYPMCYPEIVAERKIYAEGLVDAALLFREIPSFSVIPNDVDMAEERDGEKLNFFLVTGANGGGKTTYLRSVGNMLLLGLLGLPVTAKRCVIYSFKKIFTHFPADECFEGSGRFVDEERRVKVITAEADRDTVVLFNETYSGTDERKSEEYSRSLAEEMVGKGVFGLFVTHVHALTDGSIPVLSAEVDEEDENRRTYRIRRARVTHSSYAYDILKKYNLDRESLEKTERWGDHG